MNKKKLVICAVAVAVILIAIIAALVSCGGDGDENYKPKGKLEKAYKFIEQGEFEKAEEEIIKYQDKLSDNDDDEYYVTKEEFDGGIAYIRLKIAAGTADSDEYPNYLNNAGSDIEEIFKLIYDDEYEVEYSVEALKELVEWYYLEFEPEYDTHRPLDFFTEHVPEMEEYFTMEEKYEKEEPHEIYYELCIDGKPTGWKDYLGRNAYVKWEVEGFEDVEPYREFERKYIENEPTDEIRYTGKTKADLTKKQYPASECPYCGYSASLSPDNHPGHGLEGIAIFKRGQNSDGSWGFYYTYE